MESLGACAFDATKAPPRLFDAVVASEVLEHVDNPALFLETAAGLLKDGGSLFLTTINRTNRYLYFNLFFLYFFRPYRENLVA